MPPIRTQGLTKRYRDTDALVDLDLEVHEGEVFGYLGPNGSGKTTTIRILLGLTRPTAGRAEIFGIDAQGDAARAHERVAFVPGEASLWPQLTGEETLHLLGQLHGSPIDGAYRQSLVDRFDFDPSRKVRTLSKGNRQKLALIAAFMTRADLLLLDEPTSGLDPLMEQVFRQCVRDAQSEGRTVFLSSHILSEVDALCQRVGILRGGRLVELGDLASLRHLSALSIEATFGTPPHGGRPIDEAALAALEGVQSVTVEPGLVRCHVVGSMGPVLRALVDAGATRVLSREPSLEELFLAHYGNDAVGG